MSNQNKLQRQVKRPKLTWRDRALFVLLTSSLRRECLNFFLILGERHLHRTIREYVRYFNLAQPHQGIEQRIPCPPESLPHSGKVVSHPVLGGLHHDYRRQAA